VDLGALNGDLFADLVVHHFQATQSFLGVGDGGFSGDGRRPLSWQR